MNNKYSNIHMYVGVYQVYIYIDTPHTYIHNYHSVCLSIFWQYRYTDYDGARIYGAKNGTVMFNYDSINVCCPQLDSGLLYLRTCMCEYLFRLGFLGNNKAQLSIVQTRLLILRVDRSYFNHWFVQLDFLLIFRTVL